MSPSFFFFFFNEVGKDGRDGNRKEEKKERKKKEGNGKFVRSERVIDDRRGKKMRKKK